MRRNSDTGQEFKVQIVEGRRELKVEEMEKIGDRERADVLELGRGGHEGLDQGICEMDAKI